MPDYGLREPSYLGGAGRSLLVAIPVLIGLGLAGGLGYLWLKSTAPAVEVPGGFPRALGPSTPLTVRWTNPHGARRVTVAVEQNGKRTVAFEKAEPAVRFRLTRPAEAPGEAKLAIPRDGLVAGTATVVLEVQSNDLRGQTARLTHTLPVVLEKPRVEADAGPVFLRRGGTGVVTFTVGGGWSEAGVRVGRFTFPSWASKDKPERRVALFSIPPEVGDGVPPVLFARNAIGDEATAEFAAKVTPVKFRERTLELGQPLVEKVAGELDAGASGPAAERFARINSVMRRANDAALVALAAKSEGTRLWDGPFLLLPQGKAEALFADHRAYRLGGKTLNTEWHLGIDMASVKNAPVPAANRGKVVHAGRLGIYGNCVAVDHGLGVLTVYGHLDSIRVKLGETVTRGQELGRSGITGLAGGDHLHLGLMVGNAFVDPVEWSFGNWMEKVIKLLSADFRL